MDATELIQRVFSCHEGLCSSQTLHVGNLAWWWTTGCVIYLSAFLVIGGEVMGMIGFRS